MKKEEGVGAGFLLPPLGLHELVCVKAGESVGVAGIITRRDTGGVLLIHHEKTDSWRFPFSVFKPGDGSLLRAVLRMIPHTVVMKPHENFMRMQFVPIGRASIAHFKMVAFTGIQVPGALIERFPEMRCVWVTNEAEFAKYYQQTPKQSVMRELVAEAVRKGAFFGHEQGAMAA